MESINYNLLSRLNRLEKSKSPKKEKCFEFLCKFSFFLIRIHNLGSRLAAIGKLNVAHKPKRGVSIAPLAKTK